ncbi:MAG TPA: hypothetical protein DD381_01215 [Lentisphaeria bacterium]|nr:MAG: hypothetical protein A2X47_13445 [Lentisphaerae bacterium GWF2_38_69]HBM14963.1 hypothetical protein [Lentisphaeria bacterium]
MTSFSIRLIFSLLLFSVAFLFQPLKADELKGKNSYMAMVDIGSSGSRLYLYKFQVYDKCKPPLLTEIMLKNNTVAPGLYTLAGDTQKVTEYFEPIFNSLDAAMKEHNIQYKEVEFYGLGTAGMRILSPFDRIALFKSLNDLCATKGFSKVNVRVLEGHEEGLYDWITVNYLEGTLANDKETYCILDLGGGSAEIAYEVPDAIYPDTFKVTMAGKTFNVYSKSYLGLGMDFVRYQISQLPYCWQTGYPMPSDDQPAHANFFKGVDDLSILITLANRSGSFLAPDIPPDMQIIGLGGFYYLTKSKPLNLPKDYCINDIVGSGNKLSKESWISLLQNYKLGPYTFEYLFESEYIAALLKNGFHFSNSRIIHARNRINEMDSDWTLGAALYVYEGNETN